MIDLFNIPNSQQDIQIFYANGSAWQTWQKPRKCNYVYIMCIGGGGGGGNGGTVDNSNRGPGGAGAITRVLYNAFLLPDILYIQPGLGGAGGTSITLGPTLGTKSYVALQPNISVQNLVLTSGAVAASSQSETIATQTNMTFVTLGNFISTPGLTFLLNDVSPLTSTIVTFGATGGFKTPTSVVQPRSILSSPLSPLISGGISSTTTDGTDGDNGYTSWKPFFSVGGAGGGSSSVGVGGKGGKGGIGSGGGSGGAGQIAGGDGGDGGNGLVIVISF